MFQTFSFIVCILFPGFANCLQCLPCLPCLMYLQELHSTGKSLLTFWPTLSWLPSMKSPILSVEFDFSCKLSNWLHKWRVRLGYHYQNLRKLKYAFYKNGSRRLQKLAQTAVLISVSCWSVVNQCGRFSVFLSSFCSLREFSKITNTLRSMKIVLLKILKIDSITLVFLSDDKVWLVIRFIITRMLIRLFFNLLNQTS